MKILVYGDVHFSTNSSIVRTVGNKYTTRLENVIQSVNWAESLGKMHNCRAVVTLGDFFDKPDLISQEISALSDIEFFNDVPHYHLCGNHEIGSADMVYNSCNIFKLFRNHRVITEPMIDSFCGFSVGYLPYVLESKKQGLKDYFENPVDIIFSHNDIKGVQMGAVMSDKGFTLEEIGSCCKLFINGHIHNGSRVNDVVLNCGNLTGQNFSEDATVYPHGAFIVNMDTLTVEFFENPYALNFYKLDLTKSNTIPSIFKNNAILTVKCNSENYSDIKKFIDEDRSVLIGRAMIEFSEPQSCDQVGDITETLTVNHIEEFRNFVLENLGNDKDILSEVGEICK